MAQPRPLPFHEASRAMARRQEWEDRRTCSQRFGTAFATINIVEEGWLHCWTGGVVLVVRDLKQDPELRHLHFVNGDLSHPPVSYP